MYKLLIIEDEAIEREAFRKLMNERFPEIIALPDAENGLQGIELTHLYNPDILVVDINMPELDGLHTLKMLRSSGFNNKIIIHTAYNRFEYVKDALNYGADAFILKPETQENLCKTIEECMIAVEEKRRINYEEQARNKRISIMSDYITEDVISLIISNDESKRLNALDKLRKSDIQLQDSFFITVEVSYNELLTYAKDDRATQPVMSEIQNEIKMAVDIDAQVIFSHIHDNKFSILLSSDRMSSMMWYKHAAVIVAQQVRQALLHSKGMSARIGVGRPYDRVENFYLSYLESIQALCNAQKSDPVAFCTGPSMEKYQEIWNKLDEIEKDWKTERTFGHFEEALHEFIELIATEPLFSQKEQSLAFWEVICARSKKSVTGWKEAAEYHDLLDQMTAQLPEKLREATGSADIRRILMRTMVENIRVIHKAEQARPNMLVQKALSYIEENFTEDLSLEIVAKHVGISQYYLSHMFKKYLDCSFIDCLTNIRMKNVIQLLKSGQYTTNELAALTGYSNAGYFCKVVKKETGKTIKEIKRDILNNKI